MAKAVLLFTGGLHSTVLLAALKTLQPKTEIFALLVNYAQTDAIGLHFADKLLAKYYPDVKYVKISLSWPWRTSTLKKTSSKFSVIKAALFTQAYAYAQHLGAEDIYCAITNDHIKNYTDYCPDNILRFKDILYKFSNKHATIDINFPFKKLNAYEVYSFGEKYNAPLKETWNCKFPVSGTSTWLACDQCEQCLSLIDLSSAYKKVRISGDIKF